MKRTLPWRFSLLVLCTVLGSWTVQTHPPVEGIHWLTIEQADSLRRVAPRKIVIDVYTDWCGWCKRMDMTTFRDPELVKYVNEHYYAVKFNAEQRADINLGGKTYRYVSSGRRGYNELAQKMLQGKMTYPTVVFLDENFSMIQPLSGYRDAKTMKPILQYLAENAYRQTPWEEWLKKHQGN